MGTNLQSQRSSITIRPGQESDAPAYRSLRLEALLNHPESFSADHAANAEQPMTYWEDRLRSQGANTMLFFAVQDGDLVGMCAIFRGDAPKTQHSATIASVYVRPGWRGLKISEALLTRCIEWARLQAIRVLKLAVVTTNTAAIHCYARCGFRIYGIEPQAICVDGVMYDELLMERPV